MPSVEGAVNAQCQARWKNFSKKSVILDSAPSPTWRCSRLTVDAACSYFVLVGSSRQFKPPWTLIRENSECYVVKDANGVTLACLYCRDDT